MDAASNGFIRETQILRWRHSIQTFTPAIQVFSPMKKKFASFILQNVLAHFTPLISQISYNRISCFSTPRFIFINILTLHHCPNHINHPNHPDIAMSSDESSDECNPPPYFTAEQPGVMEIMIYCKNLPHISSKRPPREVWKPHPKDPSISLISLPHWFDIQKRD